MKFPVFVFVLMFASFSCATSSSSGSEKMTGGCFHQCSAEFSQCTESSGGDFSDCRASQARCEQDCREDAAEKEREESGVVAPVDDAQALPDADEFDD